VSVCALVVVVLVLAWISSFSFQLGVWSIEIETEAGV
jgi:hypothetical protein